MNLFSSQGIVLRRNKHVEADMRLSLFLKDLGKVEAIVKSGQTPRSKLKALQEPFTEADYQIYLPPQGTRARLTGGALINTHYLLRKDFAVFGMASKCCEIVDILIPYRVPTPEVYDILLSAFQGFQVSESPRFHWVLFVVRLLKHLGHGDASEHILRVLSAEDQNKLRSIFENQVSMSPLLSVQLSTESWGRTLSLIDSNLERVLPWRLKSEVLI